MCTLDARVMKKESEIQFDGNAWMHYGNSMSWLTYPFIILFVIRALEMSEQEILFGIKRRIEWFF